MRIRLLDSDNNPIEVEQDADARATITLVDFDGDPLDEASILTLEVTVTDINGTVIGTREDEDCKDAGIGVVSTAGVVSLYLAPVDNGIQDATLGIGETELHVLLLRWTWNDGIAGRTNSQEFEWPVRKVALT